MEGRVRGYAADLVRWEASQDRPELRGKRPRPLPPPELVRALRVNVENLRPWEYDAMAEDDLLQILDCKRWLQEEMGIRRGRERRAGGGGG